MCSNLHRSEEKIIENKCKELPVGGWKREFQKFKITTQRKEIKIIPEYKWLSQEPHLRQNKKHDKPMNWVDDAANRLYWTVIRHPNHNVLHWMMESSVHLTVSFRYHRQWFVVPLSRSYVLDLISWERLPIVSIAVCCYRKELNSENKRKKT